MTGGDAKSKGLLDSWCIELWGLAGGSLEEDTAIRFLEHDCNLALHYLQDQTFRLAFTSLEDSRTNSIFLELEFDQESFEEHFEFVDHETFANQKGLVALQKDEIAIKSLK